MLQWVNLLSDADAACLAIVLTLCLNMFSATDAACVAIALALCLTFKNRASYI